MKRILAMLTWGTAVLATGCCNQEQTTLAGLQPSAFETEIDGQQLKLYTLTNEAGMEVSVTPFGGRIVSVVVPDRNGNPTDVVLGFDNIADYQNIPSDFGAAIGRYANRISNGKITLEGVEYQLPQNNFGHCLHGGPNGWQYKVYEVVEASQNQITLQYFSPDGDEQFPGNVTAKVTYTLTDENAINITYEAETDATTVINMTNHTYFNLAGDPSKTVLNDVLTINADTFTPCDDTFMTTGEILPVEDTPMDFRTPKMIGAEITNYDYEQLKNGNGYDHNWVLNTAGDITKQAVELYSPASGIQLEVYTTEPGIQVYTGNFLDGTVQGKHDITYNQRAAICLETQKYPDTPNKPEWPSALLRPGEKYTSRCIYKFGVRE
ncbi:MAG: galactose mutarotase [Alistipes sp.]|nr:galactose mutarotase [Alistipes sp.]